MSLSISKTSFIIPANTHHDFYDSRDDEHAATWVLANLVAGTRFTLPGVLGNTSGGYYCIHTNRVGFIQNGANLVREYDLAGFLLGTPTLIRVITYTGTDSSDTEAVSNPEPNFLEGGYSQYIGDEGGGSNRLYRVELTRAQLVGTTNFSVAVRNKTTAAAAATGNNEGNEGVDVKWYLNPNKIIGVQEGRQIDNPLAYEFEENANRDIDHSYLTDVTVTAPFVSQTLLAPTHDQSDCLYHHNTNTILVLSDIGNMLYHIQPGTPGTVIATLDLNSVVTPLNQIEVLFMMGNNVITGDEDGNYIIWEYVP